ncbi:MAG: hypothetical protein RIR96_792, partial [Bacteroidota bacterium]
LKSTQRSVELETGEFQVIHSGKHSGEKFGKEIILVKLHWLNSLNFSDTPLFP